MASVNKARERNAPKALQDNHRPKKYTAPLYKSPLRGSIGLTSLPIVPPIWPGIKGPAPYTLAHPWGRETARKELHDRLTGWLVELWEQARKELRVARPCVLRVEPEVLVHWDHNTAHAHYVARTQLRLHLVRDSGTQRVPGCWEMARVYSHPDQALADRYAVVTFPLLQEAIRDNMGPLLQGEWPSVDDEDYVVPF